MAFFYGYSSYKAIIFNLTVTYLPQPIGDKLSVIHYNNDLREVLRHNI